MDVIRFFSHGGCPPLEVRIGSSDPDKLFCRRVGGGGGIVNIDTISFGCGYKTFINNKLLFMRNV